MARFPSLGRIAEQSPELDQIKSGRALRWNPLTKRMEVVSSWKHLLTPSTQTLATTSGNAATATALFPAGAYPFLVETEVKTAVVTTGPSGGGYGVGFDADRIAWGTNDSPTLASVTGAINVNMLNPILVCRTAMDIILTATAGTYVSGSVKVTGWYLAW